MKFVSRFCTVLMTLGLVSFISACSSSDSNPEKPPATEYTGKTTPATLTDSNKKPLSETSTEASMEGSEDDSSDFAIFKSSKSFNSTVNKAINSAVSYATTVDGACSSGSLSVTGIDETTDLSGPLDFSADYNFCKIAGSVPTTTVDGSMRFQGDIFGSNFSLTLTNFTVWEGDKDPETINLSISCTEDMSFNDVCTINVDYKGNDNRVYRMQDLIITDYGNGSFDVEGRIFDPDHGYVDIQSTTTISFAGTTTGYPTSGVLQIDDQSGNTVVVTYVDDTQYSVDLNSGGAVFYNW